MFLQHKPTGDLVEILDMENLYDPCQNRVTGRSHAGEEMQEAESFLKFEMMFPSGESLPRCWMDRDYRVRETSQNQLAYNN